MNDSFSIASGLGGIVGVLVVLISVAAGVFWMVVGWRAMRAHESIADVLRGRAED